MCRYKFAGHVEQGTCLAERSVLSICIKAAYAAYLTGCKQDALRSHELCASQAAEGFVTHSALEQPVPACASSTAQFQCGDLPLYNAFCFVIGTEAVWHNMHAQV